MKIAIVLGVVCIWFCCANAANVTCKGKCEGTEKARQSYVAPAFPDRYQYRYADFRTEVRDFVKCLSAKTQLSDSQQRNKFREIEGTRQN